MGKSVEVGETFTHVRECDRFRPVYYAAASGDFNPIHLDAEIAAMAGFGGPILHGMCTMSWAVEAAIAFLGDPALIRRAGVRFSRPVAPGDTVTFEGKVASREGRRVRLEIAARNQRDEDVLRGAIVEAEV